jgi:putative chitinase
MTTVVEVVAKLAPKASDNYREAFAAGDAILAKYAVNSPLRIAHFLAQVLHETGALTVLEENLSYRAERIVVIFGVGKHSAAVTQAEAAKLAGNSYALAERVYGVGNPRKSKELGNTSVGDGFRYRGRGIMQTTGRSNYRRLGQRAFLDFEGDPDLVVSAEHALVPALLEWHEGRLNDAADRNDINFITRRINGGYNGLADRVAWFNKAWTLVKDGVTVDSQSTHIAAQDAWKAALPDTGTKQLQLHLRELGVNTGLAADGFMGPMTRAALIEFQKLAGIPADGIYGPVTHAAIELRLAALR